MDSSKKANSRNDIAVAAGLKQCKGDNAYRKPTAQMKFLLVDDSIEIRFSIRRMLRSAGARHVDIAENGETALNMIAQLARQNMAYDAIIIDYLMPGMSGLETLAALQQRNIPQAEGTRKIILSGYLDPNIQEEAKTVGAAIVLNKPCDSASLIAAIS
ncbi:response regulator [Thalassospira sp. MA62]|nr:response regulator [Thalassospira sp. MA62]